MGRAGSPSHSARSALLVWLSLLAGVGLTLLSGGYVRPPDCRGACDAPNQAACPPGLCRPGEQRAGLPLAYHVDGRGGESPVSGWGVLGPEDPVNGFVFGLDAALYASLVWLGGAAWRRRLRPKSIG